MNKLINTTLITLVGSMLSMPVLADKMLRDERSLKSANEQVQSQPVKDGCDCKTYSDEQLKAYKENHPMNSNILRDK